VGTEKEKRRRNMEKKHTFKVYVSFKKMEKESYLSFWLWFPAHWHPYR